MRLGIRGACYGLGGEGAGKSGEWYARCIERNNPVREAESTRHAKDRERNINAREGKRERERLIGVLIPLEPRKADALVPNRSNFWRTSFFTFLARH